MDGGAQDEGGETRWLSPPPPPPPPSAAPPFVPLTGGEGAIPPGRPPAGPPLAWSPAPALAPPSALPPSPAAPSPPSRGGLIAVVVLAVALLATVGAGAWAASRPEVTATAEPVGSGGGPTSAVGPPTTQPASTAPTPTTTTNTTPTTTTAPPTRLAEPPPLPDPAGGPYAFVETEPDGDPAAWDPCRPIRFVVNARVAPPGAAEIVAEAMALVSEATGLVFVDEGPSDEVPSQEGDRAYVQPGRYGGGYAPVLFAWTDESVIPDFAERTNGQAYPTSITAPSGEIVHVTGEVAMDGLDAARRLSEGDRQGVLAVVVHELGHLVGLDHVDDIREVMFGAGVQTATWGPGDRAGLALVGRGECEPTLWR